MSTSDALRSRADRLAELEAIIERIAGVGCEPGDRASAINSASRDGTLRRWPII